ERAHVACWQGSISSYFYTPVHSMFISALVVLAVSLIAIRGCTVFDDVALNVAGVLAAIVAFVPTAPSEHECTSTPFVGGDASAAIKNNLLALIIGGSIALVGAFIGWCVLRNHRPEKPAAAPRQDSRISTIVGFVAAFVLFGVGVVWCFAFNDNFLDHAPGSGAVGMFVSIGVVVVFNALTTRGVYRVIYSFAAVAMVASFGIAFFGKLWVDHDWRHQILWLELLEIAALVVFWSAQTVEHWDGGVPTGSERRGRPERAKERLMLHSPFA